MSVLLRPDLRSKSLCSQHLGCLRCIVCCDLGLTTQGCVLYVLSWERRFSANRCRARRKRTSASEEALQVWACCVRISAWAMVLRAGLLRLWTQCPKWQRLWPTKILGYLAPSTPWFLRIPGSLPSPTRHLEKLPAVDDGASVIVINSWGAVGVQCSYMYIDMCVHM